MPPADRIPSDVQTSSVAGSFHRPAEEHLCSIDPPKGEKRVAASLTEPLCPLSPHNRFPSLLREPCRRGKMRFQTSPLSLSITLQALACQTGRGSTLEFSSRGSVYLRGIRRAERTPAAGALQGVDPHKSLQLDIK